MIKRSVILIFAALVFLAIATGCGNNQNEDISGDSAVSVVSQATSGEDSSGMSEVSNDENSSTQTSTTSQDKSSSGSSSSNGTSTSRPNSAISSNADFSSLNDAVFIGDSVTLKLRNYVTYKRKSNSSFFGSARFLSAGSLGSGNALWQVSSKSVHPSYQGQKMLIEDAVKKMGAKKVYIMLGTNDIGAYGVDKSVSNMSELIDRIKANSPGVTIVVQSATPMVEKAQRKVLNNSNLEKYNAKLKNLCSKKGYKYLDVASVMKDSKGNLISEYCSDPDGLGIHFTDEACRVWINYILKNKI